MIVVSLVPIILDSMDWRMINRLHIGNKLLLLAVVGGLLEGFLFVSFCVCCFYKSLKGGRRRRSVDV